VKSSPRGSKALTLLPIFREETMWPELSKARSEPSVPPPNWLPETETNSNPPKFPKLAGANAICLKPR
jgi:hypothetical protein